MPEKQNTTTLDKLKIMLQLSGTSYDTLLSQILEVCEGEFLALTHRDEVPTAAEHVVLRMAMVRYNMLKSEGLTSLNLSGITEAYCDYGLLMPEIKHYRKVVII